jgi:hypothetical protein
MSEIEDRLPLLAEAFKTAANTGRLSDQDWQALDRTLQLAVFEMVAGRPPARYRPSRERGSGVNFRRTG